MLIYLQDIQDLFNNRLMYEDSDMCFVEEFNLHEDFTFTIFHYMMLASFFYFLYSLLNSIYQYFMSKRESIEQYGVELFEKHANNRDTIEIMDKMRNMITEIDQLSVEEKNEQAKKYYILCNLLSNRFRICIYEKLLK